MSNKDMTRTRSLPIKFIEKILALAKKYDVLEIRIGGVDIIMGKGQSATPSFALTQNQMPPVVNSAKVKPLSRTQESDMLLFGEVLDED